MSSQEPRKNVPIYFYYLTISKQKDSNDSSLYDMQQIVDSFSKLLPYITSKNLTDRKKDITSSEKVVWLDSFEDLKMETTILFLSLQNTIMFEMK